MLLSALQKKIVLKTHSDSPLHAGDMWNGNSGAISGKIIQQERDKSTAKYKNIQE
jgi:hypothetical protein